MVTIASTATARRLRADARRQIPAFRATHTRNLILWGADHRSAPRVGDRINGSPGCPQPVTNGSDPQTGQNYVRCQEPLNVSYCTTLKNRGVKVAVLYTNDPPLPTNPWYNT